jgi:V/A-type H+-transporting ATPase subunit D
MTKIKLTKGELKRQRDALRQYQRYLPTLQLKKQQLQMEIARQYNLLAEKKSLYEKKKNACLAWAGLLCEDERKCRQWLIPQQISTSIKNIAGVDLPIFSHVTFKQPVYDLFLVHLWVDNGLEALKVLVVLGEEFAIIQKGIEILKHELRITTQRVNLFEKVKIPQAEEAIRLIKIYIGDQMANAVGRAKIAKNKIESLVFEEVAA